MKDVHIAQLVFDQPWAISRPKMREMVAVVRRHMAGVRLTEQQARAAVGSMEAPQPMQSGAIAVIPVYGILAYRAGLVTEFSGGTSLQWLAAMMRQAEADESVSTIVLRFETPGGSCDGLPEAAQQIREMRGRGTKRVVACVDVRALSAGYWLASQCDEICCTPSGSVGAIGVVTSHCDDTEAQKMEGEIEEVIGVPEKKAEINRHGPLSDERRARLMDVMTQLYGAFVGDVAKGRGVSVAKVKADFGGGDVLTATEAKAAGMVDRIEMFDTTISRLMGRRKGQRGQAAMVDMPLVGAVAEPPIVDEAPERASAALHEALAAAPGARTTRADAEVVDPDEHGECPDGYEKGEDGMCHLKPEPGDDDEAAKADAAAADEAGLIAALGR